MKKLLYILFIISPIFALSQVDTTKIPTPIARQVVKDLISGDSARAQLSVANEKIGVLQEKIVANERIITVYGVKEANYLQQIEAEKGKTSIWQQNYADLNKEFTLFKRKTFIQKAVGAIVIGSLTYYIIKK